MATRAGFGSGGPGIFRAVTVQSVVTWRQIQCCEAPARAVPQRLRKRRYLFWNLCETVDSSACVIKADSDVAEDGASSCRGPDWNSNALSQVMCANSECRWRTQMRNADLCRFRAKMLTAHLRSLFNWKTISSCVARLRLAQRPPSWHRQPLAPFFSG